MKRKEPAHLEKHVRLLDHEGNEVYRGPKKHIRMEPVPNPTQVKLMYSHLRTLGKHPGLFAESDLKHMEGIRTRLDDGVPLISDMKDLHILKQRVLRHLRDEKPSRDREIATMLATLGDSETVFPDVWENVHPKTAVKLREIKNRYDNGDTMSAADRNYLESVIKRLGIGR